MNLDNVNAEALWSFNELHTKLVLQCKKWLLDLIAYTEYIVKYTEFLNYTGSDILINVFVRVRDPPTGTLANSLAKEAGLWRPLPQENYITNDMHVPLNVSLDVRLLICKIEAI